MLRNAGLFGAIGSAIVGVQYALEAFKTGDILSALAPALVALPCMALALYAKRKLDEYKAFKLTEAEYASIKVHPK